jgi:hypothetical protein
MPKPYHMNKSIQTMTMQKNNDRGRGDDIHTPQDLDTNSWGQFMVGMGLLGQRKVPAGVGRENGGRRKKEERRKNEEERGRWPLYNTRVLALLVPLQH